MPALVGVLNSITMSLLSAAESDLLAHPGQWAGEILRSGRRRVCSPAQAFAGAARLDGGVDHAVGNRWPEHSG